MWYVGLVSTIIIALVISVGLWKVAVINFNTFLMSYFWWVEALEEGRKYPQQNIFGKCCVLCFKIIYKLSGRSRKFQEK